MLRPRITPFLLVRNGGLVKTKSFTDPKYVGDPLNAVRIFNEKEVDELVVLDIDATAHAKDPEYDRIANLAVQCRMPLCYGGGVRSLDQIERIISLGVEKVAISAGAHADPGLIQRAADAVGSQSVVVVLDVKKRRWSSNYETWIRNGTRKTGHCPIEFAKEMQDRGAGEIVINSIDRDGMMAGYDLALASAVRAAVDIPMTVVGGAGSLRHVSDLIGTIGVTGAGAGSMFVFKGPYRAVLISYPSRTEIDALTQGGRTYRPAASG